MRLKAFNGVGGDCVAVGDLGHFSCSFTLCRS